MPEPVSTESPPTARGFNVTPRMVRAGMVIGVLVLVVYVGYLARGALFPFMVGAILAFIIAPLVERLAELQPWYGRKPETARGVAVVVIYGLGIGALVLAAIFLVPALVDQGGQLIDQVPDLTDQAQERFNSWTERYNREVPEDTRKRINSAVSDASKEVAKVAETVARRSLGLVFNTLSAVLGYISVPFFVFYAIKDRDRALGRFYSYFPHHLQPDVRECVRIANHVLGAYVRAQLFLALVIFLMTFAGLQFMGVQFSLGLAFFAGLTELIPIIGPLIGFVPAFIVVIATEPEHWWWVVLFYLGVQASENYLLVPRIHGESVHMHPALVLLLLAIGGALFGLWGVLLVVPLAAATRDVFAYIYRRLGEADAARHAAAAGEG